MSSTIKITQAMIDLYDDFTHRTLDRRDFVAQMTKLAGGAAAAYAIIPLIEANQAQAAIVDESDERLQTGTKTFLGGRGSALGYYARPSRVTGRLSTVLIIHENRGLNDHIKDVARRVALEGFSAFAVDFLSPDGTPGDPDKARELIKALRPEVTAETAVAAVQFLKYDKMAPIMSNGKVAAIGFCWGGGVVNQLAASADELDAAVAFYGAAPDSAEVPNITAKMLLHYAGLDKRINAGIPGYKAALEAAGVDHTIHMYEGANHAFHNDTSATRYHKESAELAWSRTIDFLKESLA